MANHRNILSKELLLSLATFDEKTGCINWNASKTNIYGTFNADGRTYGAHRAAFMLYYPEVDISSLYVCHRCNNKRCINPEHLYAGTPKDNARDAVRTKEYLASRRGAKGEQSARAKLTQTAVISIRKRDALGENRSAIAREYQVTPQCIDEIVKRATWKHLP